MNNETSTLDIKPYIELLRKQRILIAEDEKFITDFIRRTFNTLGIYNVDVAYDGKEAKKKLEQNVYDILLTDLNMPYINGFKIVEFARYLNKEMLILVLSAHDTPEYRLTVEEMGADGFLNKPFNFIHAMEFIGTYLSQKN